MLGVPVRQDRLASDLHGDGPLKFSGGYVGRPTGEVTAVADGGLAEIYLLHQAGADTPARSATTSGDGIPSPDQDIESWAFVGALACDPDGDDAAAC